MVYHASAGKNTMGTPSPGNNSGDFTFNGSEMEMGTITKANELMDRIKL